MQFLVDENVRSEVAEFLDSLGEVKYVPRGASDKEVAKIAEIEWRILITHDKDFLNSLMYPLDRYAGIVVLRIHPPAPDIINRALSNLFARYDENALDGCIVILGSDGFVISPTPGVLE